jgi:hypothetical protein
MLVGDAEKSLESFSSMEVVQATFTVSDDTKEGKVHKNICEERLDYKIYIHTKQ